mmetsp:Transcript_7367/g.15267  ORF Transcript_7367/g.15267 Transcript_7367/m.15267 type:complete len:128 (-) Transcript_7367:425-808(-)
MRSIIQNALAILILSSICTATWGFTPATTAIAFRRAGAAGRTAAQPTATFLGYDDDDDDVPADPFAIPKLKLPGLPKISAPAMPETKSIIALVATVVFFVVAQKVGLLLSDLLTPELSAEEVANFSL